jgi:ubiquinol-cytochrome c reductase cytochrome c1 subunit
MKLRYALAMAMALVASSALAAGDVKYPRQMEWSFEGVFGRVDKQSAQRGFQVYKEVCAACHGIKRIAFRQLSGIGLTEAEIKSLAANYSIKDGPDDSGEMFERSGRPSDYFPSPHANEQAARAANNGAYPHDLSLMVKARMDGANYIYSLLTGYGQEVPHDLSVPEGAHYNPYMAGKIIKMAPPMVEDGVTYQDETKASISQQAQDVVNFLQWAAEPEMEQRKSMGIHVMLFLLIMTVFFYLVKKRVWSDLH